jgi:hypothetical protein
MTFGKGAGSGAQPDKCYSFVTISVPAVMTIPFSAAYNFYGSTGFPGRQNKRTIFRSLFPGIF